MLPKVSAYVKNYDSQTKWMYLLIEDDDLLGEYNTIWDQVSAYIQKEFESKLAYDKNFLKTKKSLMVMKLKIFTIKKLLKWTLITTCLLVIILDSALKKVENCYPQVFLKECKYIEKKIVRHINDNLSDISSSDDSDEGKLPG